MLDINQIIEPVNNFSNILTAILLCVFIIFIVITIVSIIKKHKKTGGVFLILSIVVLLVSIIPINTIDEFNLNKNSVNEVKRQIENMYNLEITDNTAKDMINSDNDDYNKMIAKSTFNENRLYQLYWQKDNDGIVEIYIKSDANDDIYKRIQPYSNTIENTTEIEEYNENEETTTEG